MKASSLRKGNVIIYNGTPYKVLEHHHHTPGNLRAMVQTKLRNILNGTQTEVRFSSTEDIREADVMSFKATYLYNDADGYHFMNAESYEQLALNAEVLGDGRYFLQDNMEVEITLYNSDPIGIQLPSTVILTIAETTPDLKGATATNAPKPATTNTGLTLSVPSFVKVGDRIVVNTDESKYLGRSDQ